MFTLATPRLIIREFLLQEQNAYLHHFKDDMVIKYLPVRTAAERASIFQHALQQYKKTSATGTWGIFNKINGEFIGSCLLREFDVPGAVELGYSLERKHWGKGLATEMAVAMVCHGFKAPDISSIVGITVLQNYASQRVLEKAGMVRIENMTRNGEELAFFRITR